MPTSFTSRVDRYGNEYLSLAGLAHYPLAHPYWRQVLHWRRRPYIKNRFPKHQADCRERHVGGERIGLQFNAATSELVGLCCAELDVVRSGNAHAYHVNVNAFRIMPAQHQAGLHDVRMELLRQFMLGEIWAHDMCYPNGPEELLLPDCDPTDFAQLMQHAVDGAVPLYDYVLWYEAAREQYTKYCFHPVKQYFIGHVVE